MDSLIGESLRKLTVLDSHAKAPNGVTPIDLHQSADSARREQELSPLPQKLVKDAS